MLEVSASPSEYNADKIKVTEQTPDEYKIDKTYSLNFSEIEGLSGLHDFNAKSFFIDNQVMNIDGKEVKYDPKEKVVNIGDEKAMSILEFLAKLNIGLQNGGFKITEYVLSSDHDRADLDADLDSDKELLN
jgi:hypothetical protein